MRPEGVMGEGTEAAGLGACGGLWWDKEPCLCVPPACVPPAGIWEASNETDMCCVAAPHT